MDVGWVGVVVGKVRTLRILNPSRHPLCHPEKGAREGGRGEREMKAEGARPVKLNVGERKGCRQLGAMEETKVRCGPCGGRCVERRMRRRREYVGLRLRRMMKRGLDLAE